MITAATSWDLAQTSGGRFILGLGTQVRAHITRRFSTEWGSPGPRLRDYIASLRAIWDTWQNGTPLRHEGEFYRFSLMTPSSIRDRSLIPTSRWRSPGWVLT
jgi:alkanesulfonate monooxygenase SsuD/methylene tetrahydromethanopterin reductase-like flavin-dependent oxidoreductase (luciferase family)